VALNGDSPSAPAPKKQSSTAPLLVNADLSKQREDSHSLRVLSTKIEQSAFGEFLMLRACGYRAIS
jgi:hypothetical protein